MNVLSLVFAFICVIIAIAEDSTVASSAALIFALMAYFSNGDQPMKRFVINTTLLLVLSPVYAMIIVLYLYRYSVVYLIPRTDVHPYEWFRRLDRFFKELLDSL